MRFLQHLLRHFCSTKAVHDPHAQALRSLRAQPQQFITQVGPTLGYFAGSPIPAWIIDRDGQQHEFVRTTRFEQLTGELSQHETLINPGLIYCRSTQQKEAAAS
jgi:hypothetical protein